MEVAFWLVRRFAPPDAQNLVVGSRYDGALMLYPVLDLTFVQTCPLVPTLGVSLTSARRMLRTLLSLPQVTYVDALRRRCSRTLCSCWTGTGRRR